MRGRYHELNDYPAWVSEMINEAEKAGSFQRGIVSDKKQRGTSINVDVFGYDEESHLAVVQVRRCIFRPRRYNTVHKNYFLIGRNENGNVFTHPVESPCRSPKALTSAKSTVDFVLSKIWQCEVEDLPKIIRQGDVAFVPDVLPKDCERVTEPFVVLRNSHRLTGEIFKRHNTFYIKKGVMKHTKGQHADIRARDMVYRVQEGVRANVYDFTLAVGD